MLIEYIEIKELKPYKNNPRNNEDSIKQVAQSIREFGFKVPIIVDKDNTIVAGHTRYEASKKLKLDKVPVIRANDLTQEQINAFRLADNKVSEIAKWDYIKLDEELLNIENYNMELLGFIKSEEEYFDWDGIENLDEELYEEPEHRMFKCPYCEHKDRDIHFNKTKTPILEFKKIDGIEIKEAELEDISQIKVIADKNANEIGFVLKPALEEQCKKKTLIVAKKNNEVLGFCNYNKRKDGINIIYEICTDYKYRGNKIAKMMLEKLKKPIQLKCPIDNESNKFYEHCNFKLIDVEEGKKRKLNVWRLE